jgi:hypothetical protein
MSLFNSFILAQMRVNGAEFSVAPKKRRALSPELTISQQIFPGFEADPD